eukprot:s3590_g8.t1
MEGTRKKLVVKGGTAGDWGHLVHSGLQTGAQLWVEAGTCGVEALDQARIWLSKVAMLEYKGVDGRERPQGKALLRLVDWEDFSRGILMAVPLVASDGYYEWYATYELADGRSPYHDCFLEKGQCPERLGHGVRSQLVHRHEWRVTCSLVLTEGEYAQPVVLRTLQDWVEAFKPVGLEPMLQEGWLHRVG